MGYASSSWSEPKKKEIPLIGLLLEGCVCKHSLSHLRSGCDTKKPSGLLPLVVQCKARAQLCSGNTPRFQFESSALLSSAKLRGGKNAWASAPTPARHVSIVRCLCRCITCSTAILHGTTKVMYNLTPVLHGTMRLQETTPISYHTMGFHRPACLQLDMRLSCVTPSPPPPPV